MRFYDNPVTGTYRVVCRNLLSSGQVQLDTWNVRASGPTAAAEWVLTHRSTGLYSTIETAYRLRRQPVWLRKPGSLDYRFDLRHREVFRPVPLELVCACGSVATTVTDPGVYACTPCAATYDSALGLPSVA